METCPGCGSDVPCGVAECPVCGVRLEGATASFKPVGVVEAPLKASSVATDGAVLVVQKGAETGERFYLGDGSFKIGRDPSSDIFLNDITVSRNHALVTVDMDKQAVAVADTGSLNGTYVNDVLVEQAVLKSGDVLQIGRFKMIYFSAGGA